jgi:crotonobetainyl-CoA:carnitine CoA-transferase CaiB-like acyl-CoA transferase
MLGQHTEEVLREWAGLDDAAVNALAEQATTDNNPYRD